MLDGEKNIQHACRACITLTRACIASIKWPLALQDQKTFICLSSGELQCKFQVSDPLDKVNGLVRKEAANHNNPVGNHFMCSENVSFFNNYLGKELIAGYDQWIDLPFTVQE